MKLSIAFGEKKVMIWILCELTVVAVKEGGIRDGTGHGFQDRIRSDYVSWHFPICIFDERKQGALSLL